MIYTSQKSKLSKKQRAAREVLLKEQRAIKRELKQSQSVGTLWSTSKVYRRETPRYPSLNSGHHDTAAKPKQTYTGSNLLGIGTLHKSNAVPIFSQEEALDQARMRRG